MARSRNIKPGFYKNETLAECSVWARLLFPGLWMLADREGRLEDRPKRIKAEIFPFDTCDAEPLLRELAAHGFIVRYEIDGERFIQISKFLDHQSPHYSEKPSAIMPPEIQETKVDDDSKTPGKLPENSRSDVLIKRGSQRPDSLIPDSLIPDCPESGKNSASGSEPIPRRTKPKRATRIAPHDFLVNAEMRAWASANHPGVNLDLETQKFRDHEFGTVRSDWIATWRNWIRNAEGFGGSKAPSSPPKLVAGRDYI